MARDVSTLNQENEKLLRKLEQAERKGASNTNTTGGSGELQQETAKRLKKREMECQALWDTIKDLTADNDIN
jgi:hypothetical protein